MKRKLMPIMIDIFLKTDLLDSPNQGQLKTMKVRILFAIHFPTDHQENNSSSYRLYRPLMCLLIKFRGHASNSNKLQYIDYNFIAISLQIAFLQNDLGEIIELVCKVPIHIQPILDDLAENVSMPEIEFAKDQYQRSILRLPLQVL